MNLTKRLESLVRSSSRSNSNASIRLMKWIVLIVLLVLVLLALFLPDRGLAVLGSRDAQPSPMHRPIASNTPTEHRIRMRSPSTSYGTAIRASS